MTLLGSCEKEGPAGQDGVTNAEVYHFDVTGSSFYKNYDVPNNSYDAILWGSDERDGNFFTIDIDKDIIFVYISSHQDAVLGEVFTALPSIFTLDANTQIKYEYSISNSNNLDYIIIDVETLNNDVIVTSNLPDVEFKIVKISGANGSNKKSNLPDIDFSDFQEVKIHYNL